MQEGQIALVVSTSFRVGTPATDGTVTIQLNQMIDAKELQYTSLAARLVNT
jgi:hypothetical protein